MKTMTPPPHEIPSDLFEDNPRNVVLASGAILLKSFARSIERNALDALSEIIQISPFRHMTTPGGWRMSVAMTNSCFAIELDSPAEAIRAPRECHILADAVEKLFLCHGKAILIQRKRLARNFDSKTDVRVPAEFSNIGE